MTLRPGRYLVAGLQAAYTASQFGAWRRFCSAVRHPEQTQATLLRRLLSKNRSTAYGQRHGFDRVASVAQFQAQVPVTTYDTLSPWIERIAQGEPNVLTRQPVRMIELSGGSTSTNKLIPYTDALLAEFAEATGAWLHLLHRRLPRLWGTQSYWSLSPATRQRETTAGGIPIGFEDDTDYFGPAARWALGRMMAVPRTVARLPDMEAWRRATLGHLLRAEDLGLISVWSPTFLTVLMQHLEADLPALLGTLPTARQRAIGKAVDARGRLMGEDLWPRLALISCWTDATAASFLPALRRWFPHVPIQPKGLLATEGAVSFPLWGQRGSVVALAGHFLEFMDLEQPERTPLLAHALRQGRPYSPLLTTGGGLTRYHLEDVVRCVGYYGRAPLIRFEGKLDRVSDLCGEKINARQVDAALLKAREEAGLTHRFALLAPVCPGRPGRAPYYCLYLDTDDSPETLQRAGDIVERYLATGHHYRYCRALGQLEPLRTRRIQNGWQTYERTLVRLGHRAGNIKPTHLDDRNLWATAFESSP